MPALSQHKHSQAHWLMGLSAGLWLWAQLALANPFVNPLANAVQTELTTSVVNDAPADAIGTFETNPPVENVAPVDKTTAVPKVAETTVSESTTHADTVTPLESNALEPSTIAVDTENTVDAPIAPEQQLASPDQAVNSQPDPAPVSKILPNAVSNDMAPMTEKSTANGVTTPAVPPTIPPTNPPTNPPLKDKPFRFSTQPANLTDNPYKLLVSLAFGTKNSLGIRSYEEAHQYYCVLARDTEDANAQFAMGWLYAMGKGVTVNHDIASYFFSKSAAQGNRDAKLWLERQQGDAELADLPACMTKPPPPVIMVQAPQAVPDPTLKITEDFFEEPKAYPRGPIYALVSKHAPAYDIDVDFAMAVIAVESAFNPKAKSPKNAQGLMQLMPETQARFNVKDPYNPEQNIKGGLSYLRWLLNYFKGDVELVAAAYNAGEQNVLKYRGVPPFQETRDYVKKIAVYYKKKFHAYTVDGQRVLDKKNAK